MAEGGGVVVIQSEGGEGGSATGCAVGRAGVRLRVPFLLWGQGESAELIFK